jgi:hypothetical protein
LSSNYLQKLRKSTITKHPILWPNENEYNFKFPLINVYKIMQKLYTLPTISTKATECNRQFHNIPAH